MARRTSVHITEKFPDGVYATTKKKVRVFWFTRYGSLLVR